MEWQEISVTTTEDAMEAVAEVFYQVGAAGVVLEDPRVIDSYLKEKKWDYYELPLSILEAESVVVKGYLLVDERLPKLLKSIREQLDLLQEYFDDYRGEITLTKIRERDWANAWKAYYQPVKVSDSIVIKPSWEDYLPKNNEIIVELDPGMAFGTGTHPSTVMCIKGIEKYLNAGQRVIDVGTGSGILAITAAKLGASHVLALDLDPLAVKVASANIKLNNVDKTVQVALGNLLMGIDTKVDIIVANIVADVVIDMSNQVPELLTDDGFFIASGIIDSRQQDVISQFEKVGLEIVDKFQQEGWIALIVRKV